MSEQEVGVERVVCRVYTHARRHPIVIGNIQGLRIPPMTPAQLGVLVGTLVVLVVTRPVWAHLGSLANGVVLLGLPVAAAWAARAVRMEGRAPWRTALGWLSLLGSPGSGVRLGRSDRAPLRAVRYRSRVWTGEAGGGGR